jgi:tetratricopeptide (TPR) repeat protein
LTDRAGRLHDLDAATKLATRNAGTLSELADVAAQLGDHARSVDLYDKAFLRAPDDLNLRINRAVALERAGRKDEAIEEYSAIEGKAANAIDLNNICWAMAIANVEIDRALKNCDKSLDLASSSATSDSRGLVMLRLKRIDDAIKDYSSALANNDSPSSLYGRAIAYARKGDKSKSDADAARALKLDPTIDQTYAEYGLTR